MVTKVGMALDRRRRERMPEMKYAGNMCKAVAGKGDSEGREEFVKAAESKVSMIEVETSVGCFPGSRPSRMTKLRSEVVMGYEERGGGGELYNL
jgi:hypothetical protein